MIFVPSKVSITVVLALLTKLVFAGYTNSDDSTGTFKDSTCARMSFIKFNKNFDSLYIYPVEDMSYIKANGRWVIYDLGDQELAKLGANRIDAELKEISAKYKISGINDSRSKLISASDTLINHFISNEGGCRQIKAARTTDFIVGVNYVYDNSVQHYGRVLPLVGFGMVLHPNHYVFAQLSTMIYYHQASPVDISDMLVKPSIGYYYFVQGHRYINNYKGLGFGVSILIDQSEVYYRYSKDWEKSRYIAFANTIWRFSGWSINMGYGVGRFVYTDAFNRSPLPYFTGGTLKFEIQGYF